MGAPTRVNDGARTRDNQNHNLVLYQLNYIHLAVARRVDPRALSSLEPSRQMVGINPAVDGSLHGGDLYSSPCPVGVRPECLPPCALSFGRCCLLGSLKGAPGGFTEAEGTRISDGRVPRRGSTSTATRIPSGVRRGSMSR
jgi:hypothetical protein